MTEMKHEASLAIKSDEICDLIKMALSLFTCF